MQAATQLRPAFVGIRSSSIDDRESIGSTLPLTTFESVYRDHYQDLYRYVLMKLGRPDDVEDIVADAFDRAFAAWRSGRAPTGRPLPWLIVMARRIMVDRWRRTRLIRWLPLGGDEGHLDPRHSGDAQDRAEIWIWLEQLAGALPERQRDVILLRYQRDLTDDEIGEILGLSASGVRTVLSRALETLRDHPELWS